MREGRGWGHYNSIERKTSQLVLVRDAVAAIVTYTVSIGVLAHPLDYCLFSGLDCSTTKRM